MKVARSKILASVVLVGIGATLFVYRPWQSNLSNALHLYGNVDVREVQLAFRVAGRLATLHVDEGESVESGDTVATLDPEPAKESRAIAKASVVEAEAQLARVSAGARSEEIGQLRAAVEEARITFVNAERHADRQQQLFSSQNTSRMVLDDATSARGGAAARLAAAREVLHLAEAGPRDEDIVVAQAALRTSIARLNQAETTLDDTVLKAPSAGIVLTRAREPGAFVAAGQAVFAIALTDRSYVRAYVDEPRLERVAPGTAVTIETDSGSRYSGTVGFVSPRAEFTPKTVETPSLRTALVYRIRILVDASDDALRQGMPVTVLLGEEVQ